MVGGAILPRQARQGSLRHFVKLSGVFRDHAVGLPLIEDPDFLSAFEIINIRALS